VKGQDSVLDYVFAKSFLMDWISPSSSAEVALKAFERARNFLPSQYAQGQLKVLLNNILRPISPRGKSPKERSKA
tara:strand:- start:391 stop:615 length:225 start_codon:yes stop_codon:yes gene_type:complete